MQPSLDNQMPHQAQNSIIDFDQFVDVLCGIGIRSGSLHDLDRVVTESRTPAERALNVLKTVSQCAAVDPGISRVLDRLQAVNVMRQEIVQRMQQGR